MLARRPVARGDALLALARRSSPGEPLRLLVGLEHAAHASLFTHLIPLLDHARRCSSPTTTTASLRLRGRFAGVGHNFAQREARAGRRRAPPGDRARRSRAARLSRAAAAPSRTTLAVGTREFAARVLLNRNQVPVIARPDPAMPRLLGRAPVKTARRRALERRENLAIVRRQGAQLAPRLHARSASHCATSSSCARSARRGRVAVAGLVRRRSPARARHLHRRRERGNRRGARRWWPHASGRSSPASVSRRRRCDTDDLWARETAKVADDQETRRVAGAGRRSTRTSGMRNDAERSSRRHDRCRHVALARDTAEQSACSCRGAHPPPPSPSPHRPSTSHGRARRRGATAIADPPPPTPSRAAAVAAASADAAAAVWRPDGWGPTT